MPLNAARHSKNPLWLLLSNQIDRPIVFIIETPLQKYWRVHFMHVTLFINNFIIWKALYVCVCVGECKKRTENVNANENGNGSCCQSEQANERRSDRALILFCLRYAMVAGKLAILQRVIQLYMTGNIYSINVYFVILIRAFWQHKLYLYWEFVSVHFFCPWLAPSSK